MRREGQRWGRGCQLGTWILRKQEERGKKGASWRLPTLTPDWKLPELRKLTFCCIGPAS